jgi:hypothetical protein
MKLLLAILLLSMTGCGLIFHAEKVTFGFGDNEGLKSVSEVTKSIP